MILKLQQKEAELLRRYSNEGFTSGDELTAAINDLLDAIVSFGTAFNSKSDLDWACQATVRWESFLRSKFDIWRTTKLPSFSKLPRFKTDTHVGFKDTVIGNIEDFESSIQNLSHTFIVSSSPTIPEDGLKDVMKKKAAIYKTKYIFLLSKKVTFNKKKELHEGFISLFQEAISEYSIYGSKADDFFGLYSLDYDWESYPYIFYDTRDKNGKREVFAVRGSKEGVAISDPYILIPSDYARDIWTGITSSEPKEDKLQKEFHELKKDIGQQNFSNNCVTLKLINSR